MSLPINPLALNLQKWLHERGLKPIQLADQAQMSRSQLCRILQGRSYPSIESLKRLADVLAVTPGTLLDGKAPELEDLCEKVPLDSSIVVALRSLKQLSAADRKQILSIIQRYAATAQPS